MAASQLYRWQAEDSIWRVAGQYLVSSGFTDTSSYVDAIRAANLTIDNWKAVPAGTAITLPSVQQF